MAEHRRKFDISKFRLIPLGACLLNPPMTNKMKMIPLQPRTIQAGMIRQRLTTLMHHHQLRQN